MNILLIVAAGAFLLVVAGRTYPFWIAKVFGENDDNPPPSQRFADGKEYVKTPTQVVFAHHFASIAGAGPIVGPILALAFGWGPAWLWIILGAIFYGAVHDMTAMFVSVREGGRTIAEIARRTLGTTGFLLFVVFLILVLCLINAIFLNLSAVALTSLIPVDQLGVDPQHTLLKLLPADANGVIKAKIGGIATTSVFVMTAFAPLVGFLVHRRGLRGFPAFGLAAVICVASVIIGFAYPLDLYSLIGSLFPQDDPGRTMDLAQTTWRWVLAGYVFVGCWIPVWLILQPRDFTNVQILYGGLILLFAGALVAGFSGSTVAIEHMATLQQGSKALNGPIWPFLFVTIACGAISGFHSVVATGTTVKQIPRESDCRRVGYYAMLLESFLALLVLMAVASQLPHSEYMSLVWPEEGRGNAVLAFALGCGRLFEGLGVPIDIGSVLGILILEGFLITTLDTAIRLCRYLLEELWNCLFAGRVPAALRWRATNTLLAVGGMLAFAFSALYEQIWPIFGSGNQLIGALALTTVTVWLIQRGKSWWFVAIPAAFMVITTMAALWSKMLIDAEAAKYPLAAAGAFLFALAIGFVVVGGWRIYQALRTAARSAGPAPGPD